MCVDMSAELLKVSEWANRLSLNVDKTSLMLFTHKVVNRDAVQIGIGGRIVQRRSAKFLGILIDDRLSFNQHAIALRKNFSVVWLLCIRCQGVCQGLF